MRARAGFHELVTVMGNWETEIFAYFDHPITNAYTESLNNLIRMTNRIGRGYSFNAIRAKLLYAETGRKRPKRGYYDSRPRAPQSRLVRRRTRTTARTSHCWSSALDGARCSPASTQNGDFLCR